MEDLPDLTLVPTPTDAELAQLDAKVKSLGGVHLDEICEGRTHQFSVGEPVLDTGCGNELMYEIPYIRTLPKLMLGHPAGKGTVKFCAVCDSLFLKPRFLTREIS